jgi:hypothetical protein
LSHVAATQVPTSGELLRLPLPARGCQFEEILGAIDILRYPRQLQNDARQTSSFSGGEMRQETVIAESQRK